MNNQKVTFEDLIEAYANSGLGLDFKKDYFAQRKAAQELLSQYVEKPEVVYNVIASDYDDHEVLGTFLTLEEAEEFNNSETMKKAYAYIEEEEIVYSTKEVYVSQTLRDKYIKVSFNRFSKIVTNKDVEKFNDDYVSITKRNSHLYTLEEDAFALLTNNFHISIEVTDETKLDDLEEKYLSKMAWFRNAFRKELSNQAGTEKQLTREYLESINFSSDPIEWKDFNQKKYTAQ